MKKYTLLLLLLSSFFIQCDKSPKENTKDKIDLQKGLTPQDSIKRTLVWSDEFDRDGLPDEEKWSYSEGDGCPNLCGWGNNEKQYYTKERLENTRIENGILIIETKKDTIEGKETYSSAKLSTKGKGDWKYGQMEIRAKLPSGRGTWPAIWMLPSQNVYGKWPNSGEIDIMEHVGYDPDSIFGTVHTGAYNHMKGTHKGARTGRSDAESAFHIYKIEWTADQIDFYVDDEAYFSFRNEKATSKEWPFDQDFYLIINLAIGGSWGGIKGLDETIFPQKMEIDYVRVYQ